MSKICVYLLDVGMYMIVFAIGASMGSRVASEERLGNYSATCAIMGLMCIVISYMVARYNDAHPKKEDKGDNDE